MNKFEKKSGYGKNKPFKSSGAGKPKPRFTGEKEENSKKNEYKAKRSFTRNKGLRENKDGAEGERKPYRPFEKKSPYQNKFKKGGEKPFGEKPTRFNSEKPGSNKSFNKNKEGNFKRDTEGGKKPRFNKRGALAAKDDTNQTEFSGKRVKFNDFEDGRAFSAHPKKERFEFKKYKAKGAAPKKQGADDGLIRLNKYLSNAGIASRREADILIQSGSVKVNGVVVDQLGYKIKPGDKVTYGDEAVKSERKVYLLLNKPKDYITTVDDPQERKTVMELINGACRERVYPVGRLDRNTTGLLLFTNDGEITTKLTHPKFGVKKIYHVSLNKGLKPDDFRAIIEGVELEDGMVKADDLAFVGEGKKEVGIEIHSGRNRIVRRLFEHLGYDVIKLDRVAFAGLTKKDLPRGKYRFLTAKEISYLHMVG